MEKGTMVQAAHSEHAVPKASLGSDASERIAMRFSLTHITYSHIARACLRIPWCPLRRCFSIPSHTSKKVAPFIKRGDICVITHKIKSRLNYTMSSEIGVSMISSRETVSKSSSDSIAIQSFTYIAMGEAFGRVHIWSCFHAFTLS